MAKLIRNDSVSTIVLNEVGLEIASGDTYTITVDEYLRWASDASITEVTPHINAADLVVNDGTSDLSAADGIRFLEYADRAYIQLDDVDVTKVNTTLNFEGDVSIVDDGNGKTTVTIGEEGVPKGKLIDFFFVASGNSSNKWLGVGNGSTSSDTLPYVIPWDANITSLTFTNQDDNVDTNVQIFKNGTLLYTWEVRNKRTAWITDLSSISFSQGDRVSCFLDKYTGGTGDNSAQDPIIELTLTFNGDNIGEGGTQYGV